MMVYQLMSAEHGLQNLAKRRLKVALPDDLNDPFELMPLGLAHASQRAVAAEWRAYMATTSRMLCFSKIYMNPLMWSHYADKHRGICLGFSVPRESLLEVAYVAARLDIDLQAEKKAHGGVRLETVQKLLSTKFADWQYEREVRMFVHPEEVTHEGGLQFYGFGPSLELKAIYAGPRSKLTKQAIEAAVQPQDSPDVIAPTRLAFKSFHVIRTPWTTRSQLR